MAAVLAWLVVSRSALPAAHGLRWNGSAWCLSSQAMGESHGAARLMIDLGSWLLVRFEWREAQPARRLRVHWLSMSRHDNPASWHGLRVALHASPTRTDRPPAADTTA
ncbi:MAG: hypothetical protein ABIR94_03560 [Rubrivivax sp.]